MDPVAARLPIYRESTAIRRLRLTDLEASHAYRSDERLARFQGWSAMDLETARAFLTEMIDVDELRQGDWIQLGITRTDTDVLIGDVGLYLDEEMTVAEVGFTLSRDAHGQGHATRAMSAVIELVFSTTPVRLVRALADSRNTPSIGVLERSGFRRVSEKETVFKGEPCTEFVYVYRRGQV